MLLVSSIMMVSSTYAWFTLSTAPEVTGITTAVGANGNLEMALLPRDGQTANITSSAGDSVLDIERRNVTWGNLVDLSNSSVYGLNEITLFPSALNISGDTIQAAMLSIPQYGADGRVSELSNDTVTGVYDSTEKAFYPDSGTTTTYGVRAVGTASGMTDRQLDYRNARSAANTATAQAKTTASQSLNNNGSALANIAIEHGMGGTDESYGKADVESLRAIIDDLKGTATKTGALQQIETAYMQYILAYAASAEVDTDTLWQAVSGAVKADGATLDKVINALGGESALPDGLGRAIAAYKITVSNVNTADTQLKALETTLESDASTTFNWEQIREAMTPLANPDAMKINGFEASEVKAKLGEIVSSVTAQGGLIVTMATDGGVYADIADQCGDYTASVTIQEVNYNGIVLNNMTARMETKTSVSPQYLPAIGIAVTEAGAPASGATGSMPITDMYGYVVDLAFRTNAAESNLLLQQDAIDRIYDTNTTGAQIDGNDETTMGHGSSMTFKATTTDFSNDQVKELMKAIRIVFFETNTNKVIATAKLDVAAATLGTDGITAKMYIYTLSTGDSYEAATFTTGSTGEYYTKTTVNVYTVTTDTTPQAGKTYYTDQSGTEATITDSAFAENTTYYEKSTKDEYVLVQDNNTLTDNATVYIKKTAGSEVRSEDNKIMALTQNTATALSVLVYLDGNEVGNDDVAATAASSMTGSMNLQFASSANLVPMEYTQLMDQGGTPMTNVNKAANTYTVSDASFTGQTIRFKLADSQNATISTGTVQVAVGSETVNATYSNGIWSATVSNSTTLAANTEVLVTYTAPTTT